jgi:hypothetical protein
VVTVRFRPLLAVPLLSVACGMRAYHPVFPHAASDRDAIAVVQSLQVIDSPVLQTLNGTVGLEVDLSVPPGTVMGGASLNEPGAARCQAGVRASGNSITTPRNPWEPTHVVLSFDLAAADGAGLFDAKGTVLDLPLYSADRSQPARCLRVPLQSLRPVWPEWRSTPWFNGLELRGLYLARPLPNYHGGGFLLGLSTGTWVNRWRVAGVLEGGLVGERVPASAPSEGTPVVGLLGSAVTGDRILLQGREMAVDLQLAYDVLATIAPDAERSPVAAAYYQKAVLHGPRVGLRLLSLFGPKDPPGFVSPPDQASAALSLFVAAWWQGTHSVPSPVLGASLEGNLGY